MGRFWRSVPKDALPTLNPVGGPQKGGSAGGLAIFYGYA
jgi:hypothetical protein